MVPLLTSRGVWWSYRTRDTGAMLCTTTNHLSQRCVGVISCSNPIPVACVMAVSHQLFPTCNVTFVSCPSWCSFWGNFVMVDAFTFRRQDFPVVHGSMPYFLVKCLVLMCIGLLLWLLFPILPLHSHLSYFFGINPLMYQFLNIVRNSRTYIINHSGDEVGKVWGNYRRISNIRRTKSQHLKDSHTVLRLSLSNP